MGHQVGTQVERAYRRTDVLDKRRQLMEAWATCCEPPTAGKVVVMIGRRGRFEGLQMPSRRFVVKIVTRGSPGWSGGGCKHPVSAEALFERRESDVEPGDGLRPSGEENCARQGYRRPG